MTYSYNREAASGAYRPYSDDLTQIQESLVGNVAKFVFGFVSRLHQNLARRAPYEDIHGFENWDYGPVNDRGVGVYHVTIYLKSAAMPDSVGDAINLYVKFDSSIEVEARAPGSHQLVSKKFPFNANSAEIGSVIGNAWEKLLAFGFR